jgi:endonuclease/exonuclease/phosphatase family metal-dependent hydrolase
MDPLRVASFNVRYAGIDDGGHAWERRRDAVAATVRFHRPDVLCLQECWLDTLEDLRDRLSAYAWVAHPNASGEHTPIGYRRDRLSVVGSGSFALSETPERRNSVGWDGTYPRLVTHATVEADAEPGVGPDLDGRLAVYSVHLDHEGERARREGVKLLSDRVPDPPTPAVVAGDFNCTPGSPPYERATADLVDAREAAPYRYGPAETYVGFGGEAPDSEAGRRRIDYAFVRGVEVEGYGVPTPVDGDGHRPSDHRPVVVDLRVR